MTPTVIRWFGAAIIFGVLALVAAAALHDIVVGESDIKNEVIALVGIAVVVVAALLLRVKSRKRH